MVASENSDLLPFPTPPKKLVLARLHAAILTSSPPLPALRSRQGWACVCTLLLASPDPGLDRPLASSIVPSGRVVVCFFINSTIGPKSNRMALLSCASCFHLLLLLLRSTLPCNANDHERRCVPSHQPHHLPLLQPLPTLP